MGCFPAPDLKSKSRSSPSPTASSASEPSQPNRNGSAVSPPSSPSPAAAAASLVHHRHAQLSRSRSTHSAAASIDIRRASPGIDLGCSPQSFGAMAFHALKHGHRTAMPPPPNSLRRASSCNKHRMKQSADPLQLDPKRSSSPMVADRHGQQEENSRVIFHSAPLSADPDRVPKLNTRPFFFPLPLPPSAASQTSDDTSSQSLSTTTTSTPSSSSSSSSSVHNSSPNKTNNHVTLTSHSWALHTTDLQPNPPPLPLPLPPDIVPLREYSFDELAGACLNFAAEFYIRNGGIGPVYRATLRHSSQDELEETLVVAITKLSGFHPQSFRKWRGEVELVACLPHPNLTRLLGFTGEDPSTKRTNDHNNAAALRRARLLVFEHTSNGSLDSLLYCRNGNAPLDWAKRLRIAAGAAEGLAFLHDRMPKQIIYKVFKTSNIQVDDSFNAKLSDFGFTRSCKEMWSTSEETMAATQQQDAYAAPEILASPPPASGDREAWIKSHVWSFGVVLLELLTGRQNKDALFPPEERNLVEWCRPYMLDSKKLYLVMDPELKGRYPTNAAKTVADLALLCLADDPVGRPSMKNVADVLASQIKPKLFRSYEAEAAMDRSKSNQSVVLRAASPGRTPLGYGNGRRWRGSMMRQKGEQHGNGAALLERFLWSGDQVMAEKGSEAPCHRHVFLSGEATG